MNSYNKKYCHGSHSIQREINNIAYSSGQGWQAKIKSLPWREAVRLKLQETTREWCDYRANTCMCD